MNIKFSPNLFLETIELERFKDSLDREGFRKLLLQKSESYGVIYNKLLDPNFENFKVKKDLVTGVDYILIEEGLGLDQFGNFFYLQDRSIKIPTSNEWYWVKASHTYTPQEEGVFSISATGELVGLGSSLIRTLRGQPNFPSRIKFLNSTQNILEYDVIQVIDDSHAIIGHPSLSGGVSQFIPETNLTIGIVGTFTPGIVVPTTDKYPFQYDGCSLVLVKESVPNQRPSFIPGSEFYVARVKFESSQVVIQDKRTEFHKYKSEEDITYLQNLESPLIGVEQINWSSSKTDNGLNLVLLSWSFRSYNWSIDTSSNTLTLLSGIGGRFKTINDFSSGDFNGYRVYTKNGKYSKVLSSIKQGSAINLKLDILDVDNYSEDGGVTNSNELVLVVPDCEFIELRYQPIDNKYQFLQFSKLYPINTSYVKEGLVVYAESSKYIVSYRYKSTLGNYTDYRLIPDDMSVGYIAESSFNEDGSIKPLVTNKVYEDGIIELMLSPLNIANFKSVVFAGDLLGVDQKPVTNATQVYDLVVGRDRKTQILTFTNLTIQNDIFINLNKVKSDGTGVINGNQFILQLVGSLSLNNRKLRVVTDYQNPITYTLLREFTQEDINFIVANQFPNKSGLTLIYNYDGTNWILSTSNEDYQSAINSINSNLLQLSNSLSTEIQNRIDGDNGKANRGGNNLTDISNWQTVLDINGRANRSGNNLTNVADWRWNLDIKERVIAGGGNWLSNYMNPPHPTPNDPFGGGLYITVTIPITPALPNNSNWGQRKIWVLVRDWNNSGIIYPTAVYDFQNGSFKVRVSFSTNFWGVIIAGVFEQPFLQWYITE